MIKKNLKNQNGITLISLTVYIIVMLIVLGILSTVSNFFYGNLNRVKDTARYASEFDKFNSNILIDVKSNHQVKANNVDKTIIFEDGTTYKYNEADEGIYRGENKIASHVKAFSVSSKTIVIDNVDKDILTINILIGSSEKDLINKKIDYTLKYW